MKNWKLKRTKQCAKCPWRKDCEPNTIPNGYSAEKHHALKSTIAKPCDIKSLTANTMHVMACHESHDAMCVGWLVHQLGHGNNIALRIKMMSCANADKIKLFGEQHKTFEDTLPV